MSARVILLMMASLVATSSGFIREIVVAYYYGTSAASDAFALVLLYVEGISVVVIVGLSGAMLVPLVTRLDQEAGPRIAERLMETLVLWTTVISVPFIIAGLLVPGWIVALIAPHFSISQNELLRVLLPGAILGALLVMLGGIVGGVLQARAAYVAPALGRAAFSWGIVASLLIGRSRNGIKSAMYGLLVGGAAQFVIQAAALWRAGWRPSVPRWTHTHLTSTVAFGLPTVTALFLTNFVMGGAQRVIASALPEGSFAAINYAQRTLGTLSFLGLSIGTVSLTELSLAFNQEGDGVYTRRVLRGHLDIVSFLMVPVSIWLMLAATPVVAILFRRGSYDTASLAITVTCLKWFTLSLVPGSLLMIFHRACPALERPWSMTIGSAMWVIATLTATTLMLPRLQAVALPAAYVAGIVVGLLVFAWIFRDSAEERLLLGFSRYLMASIARAGFASLPLIVARHWLFRVDDSALAIFCRTAFGALLYGLSYLTVGVVTGDRQSYMLLNGARRAAVRFVGTLPDPADKAA